MATVPKCQPNKMIQFDEPAAHVTPFYPTPQPALIVVRDGIAGTCMIVVAVGPRA